MALANGLTLVYCRYRPTRDLQETSVMTHDCPALTLTVTLAGHSGYRATDGTPLSFRAWELLEAGERVSTAAYKTGFEHPSNFSAAFQRHFGRSPKSVRAAAAAGALVVGETSA